VNTITNGTGTLTLGAGSSLITSATNAITLTSTGATNVTLPTSGTLLPGISGSEILDFASTAFGTQSQVAMTVVFTGAVVGDAVSVGGPMVAEGLYFAYVSAANTVTVRYINTSTTTAYEPDGTYNIRIVK